ncbi:hypothetical protein BN903_24 [Halorubrum sp. AJ67]|nr:hypothetical protein BN903_24 [Halorubrum sp. AJ67]
MRTHYEVLTLLQFSDCSYPHNSVVRSKVAVTALICTGNSRVISI